MIRPIVKDLIVIIWCDDGIIYEAYVYTRARQIAVFDTTNNKLIYKKYNIKDEELKNWATYIAKQMAIKKKHSGVRDVGS